MAKLTLYDRQLIRDAVQKALDEYLERRNQLPAKSRAGAYGIQKPVELTRNQRREKARVIIKQVIRQLKREGKWK